MSQIWLLILAPLLRVTCFVENSTPIVGKLFLGRFPATYLPQFKRLNEVNNNLRITLGLPTLSSPIKTTIESLSKKSNYGAAIFHWINKIALIYTFFFFLIILNSRFLWNFSAIKSLRTIIFFQHYIIFLK